MEEDKRKKGIDLDWEVLLPRQDDEPPILVIATTNATNRKPSPMPMGNDKQEQSPRAELDRMTDGDLEKAIQRLRCSGKAFNSRLPDGGQKLEARIERLEEERERRKLCRAEEVDGGCKKLKQSKSPYFTGASDKFRQEALPSLLTSQSFATSFCKKIEEKADSRTVNAFEKELSILGCCDSRKMRFSGKFSPRERDKSSFSSRQSPFCRPTGLSTNVDKHISSDGDHNGGRFSTRSRRHIKEKLSDPFFKKRKALKTLPLNDLRPKNQQTFVLVDDEEPQLVESLEQTNKIEECMPETRIYYPSSDDPEFIEICSSDMGCLAPEAFLSSTIMNFYIRFLQHLNFPIDRARSDCHFFNTYFYKKLKGAVLKKSDGESLFVKFRRWWKGVNIFHKAYIFLPIHENLHWSLIIICIPDKGDESGPIILHLDSLGLHFSKPIFDNVRRFLIEEWKYLNQGEAPPDLPISDSIWASLPGIIEEKTIEVPQQRNAYDCGPFVLFFMERFIGEAPQRLKKQDLEIFGKKWFFPEEASNLRHKIRKLLMKEFQNATKDNSVLDCGPLSSSGPPGERSSSGPPGERIELLIDC